MNTEARFFSKVEQAADCWNWIASSRTTHSGLLRPQFWDGQRVVKAYRWSWEFFFGPIPDGLHIDHECHNTLCVNPWHLDVVTPLVNVNRRRPGGRRNQWA